MRLKNKMEEKTDWVSYILDQLVDIRVCLIDLKNRIVELEKKIGNENKKS